MFASLASRSSHGGSSISRAAPLQLVLENNNTAVRYLSSSRRSRRSLQKKPAVTTKDRLRSARPSSHPSKQSEEKIASPQELADRAVQRLKVARSTLQEVWNSGSNETTTTAPTTKGLVMDANWWFWNVLLALSPALLIGVYCQFVVIPRMMEQNKDLIREEASKLTWTESLQQLMQYLQGVEIQNINDKETATAARTPNNTPNQTASDEQNNAVQRQLQELRRQLEQLEQEINQTSVDEDKEAMGTANSNIRHRYVEEQRRQRRQHQQQQQLQTNEDASSNENEGKLQKMVVAIQGWWSQYMEYMKDAPHEATTTVTPPSPATAAAATIAASQNGDDNDDSLLPSPPVQRMPNPTKPCKITRSITHPRDHESEHPLWTLWHKPSD